MISLIAAMDLNGVIGNDNKLPWRLPADLAYFKKVTTGHTIIMGRKTFESIGKPLPNRKSVILTTDQELQAEGCAVVHSVPEALKFNEDEEVFVIGGAKVFAEFIPYAERLYITLIEEFFEGDTFFPEIDHICWQRISQTKGDRDERNPFEYYFLVYERKRA